MIEELHEAIIRERPTIEREIRLITEAGDNEAVLDVNITIMKEIKGRLIDVLKEARRLLDAHEV